jgi:HAD superfamily phosphatase (TIGR01668 family)
LKEHAEANFGPDTTMWVRSLVDAGLAVCLVSNGRAQRIGGLARALEVEFVANALKPSPRGCLRAARRLGIQPSRLVMVGDQVFADILAGRLAGMATVLVTPRSSREPWFTRLKRPFEAWVLRHSAARARFEGAR